MIDFLLGCALTAGIAAWIFHYTRASGPGAGGISAALFEGLKQMISQSAQDIVTALEAIPAKVSSDVAALNQQVADLTAQLETAKASQASAEAAQQAEQQQHGEDLTAIQQALATVQGQV